MKFVNNHEHTGSHAFGCDHCGHRARPASCEIMAFIQARTEGYTVLVTPASKFNYAEKVAQVKMVCRTCRPLFGVEQEVELPELPKCP